MRWFTSDWHLDHEAIIDHCERPFYSLDDMAAGLAERWHTCVDANDEVWVLGDVALRSPGPGGGARDVLGGFLAELPGTKHLVLGNHDRGWRDGRLRPGWAEPYLDLGFADVMVWQRLVLANDVAVWVSHLPVGFDEDYRGEDVESWRRACPQGEEANWRLCGHVHGRWRQRDRQINVGVDAWAGFPVSEVEIGLLMAAGPAERQALLWSPAVGMSW